VLINSSYSVVTCPASDNFLGKNTQAF